MWTAVYMAEGIEVAKKIKQRLQNEGFLVKIQPFSSEGELTIYQILAPEFEASEVQATLIELGF